MKKYRYLAYDGRIIYWFYISPSECYHFCLKDKIIKKFSNFVYPRVPGLIDSSVEVSDLEILVVINLSKEEINSNCSTTNCNTTMAP